MLVWGLGVSAAAAGALLVLGAMTQRFLVVFDWGSGVGDFPWLGTVALAAALPFVALVLAIWTRVAMGSRAGTR